MRHTSGAQIAMGAAMPRRHSGFMLLIVGLLGATHADARVDAVTDAIWRVQQIDLRLKTGDQYYSCASLRSKISAILGAVGAAKVVVNLACHTGMLTNNVWARLATASPTHATEENIRAATTYDSRTQLVARIRETTLPSANDIAIFPAEWRTVSLTSLRGMNLGPGDCTLLQGLSEQIFPHLELRVVRKRLNCGQNARPILIVEALMPREA